MKKRLKKIFNNKIFMFIFGGVLFSAVSVYAVTYFPSNQVTYDNSSSKLSSTNVQGAIDELYNTCKTATSTSSGNYLYYVTTKYGWSESSSGASGTPMQSTLIKCDLNGQNCTDIVSIGGGTGFYNINSIYATKEYIYYVTTQYGWSESSRGASGTPMRSTLTKCDLNGQNCTDIVSIGGETGFYNINSIYATKEYIYYVTTQYGWSESSRGASGTPMQSTLIKCDLNGQNCTDIVSAGGGTGFYNINI